MRSILQTIATQDDLLDLRNEIGKIKANNIKWMFIFWVGQVGAMLAILLVFLKK